MKCIKISTSNSCAVIYKSHSDFKDVSEGREKAVLVACPCWSASDRSADAQRTPSFTDPASQGLRGWGLAGTASQCDLLSSICQQSWFPNSQQKLIFKTWEREAGIPKTLSILFQKLHLHTFK